jgi:ribonuclease D
MAQESQGGYVYIDDSQALQELADALKGSPFIALDTEFMRERTYFANLCLIQIAADDVSAIVDPLAVDDLAPLWEVLADPATTLVLHAGDQDLEILYREMGTVPGPVFDTQIAATLAGFPQQVGYGALVEEVTGKRLAKGDTYSDWSKRPLSERQVEYALDDVRYLPQIYETLHARLAEEGRLSWLEGDFERLARSETYDPDPALLWKRVKRASSLDRRGLGVLRELAAWREEEAKRRNVPRRWVLGDESLVEVARRQPRSRDELGAVRGVSDKLRKSAYEDVLRVVKTGCAVPDADLPRLEKRKRRQGEVEGLVDMLSAVVKLRARENKVAVPLLASRKDLEALAGGQRDGSPLLEGWRRAIVGDELVEVIDGKVSMRVKNGRLVLDVVEEGNSET